MIRRTPPPSYPNYNLIQRGKQLCRRCGKVRRIREYPANTDGYPTDLCALCLSRDFKKTEKKRYKAGVSTEEIRNPTRRTFSAWLKAQADRQDHYIGDLARDAIRDEEWPRGNHYSIFVLHLTGLGACDGALRGLEEAYEEWLKTHAEPKPSKPARALRVAKQNYTLSLRFNVFKRDSYRCQICGVSAKDGARLEVDHVYPVSRGGTDDPENLQTLCFECNRGKRDQLL